MVRPSADTIAAAHPLPSVVPARGDGDPMTMLEGKRLLITGVLTRDSIAYAVAELAQEQGADIVLTSFGRAMSLTEKSAKRLPRPVDVLEMDANDPEQVRAVAEDLERRWGTLDGFLHAIAFAPRDALGGNFLDTPWESVSQALQTSAYSLKAIAAELLPLMKDRGAGIVSLDFDAQVAWPLYDWMGVAKAGLEAVTRYLARDLGAYGVRVNCVSAGPLRTIAAKGIPGFDVLADGWGERAPLGWDTGDPSPVARASVFLLSDWASGITGEIVHVDGGYHAIGTSLPSATAGDATEADPTAEGV
jgi:enoyl-[acyl-carrier protein] reductase I